MPAQLAKGLVITVTILVAAGIAVYENPHVKQWIQNSRRKIAVALHNLGDEINPRESSTDRRSTEDISMTEELGEEAEARRQKAREEILRRASILKARKNNSSVSVGSFDGLVDKDGRLKEQSKPPLLKEGESMAKATGVEVTSSHVVHRRPEDSPDLSRSISEMSPRISSEHRQAILDNIDRDRLRTTLSSETSSNHPSESLADLTPTSEIPDMDFSFASQSEILGRHRGQRDEHPSQSNYFSLASSLHPEDGEADFYYARPPNTDLNITVPNLQQQSRPQNPFEDPRETDSLQHVSTAVSVASSLSHIENGSFDPMSDGTLSDLGSVRDGTHTPASWSEVGSVTSSNDGLHNHPY
ncbi:hypothetical protein GX48_03482 [Paracoccidioides brasiliensis]|nr:hypothetical protein GX48_03482 [Paracoccidioides brasiliensis]